MDKPCDCISYNQPKEHQKTPEVVLEVPAKFMSERKSVCVDACIADAVRLLWSADIWTLNSCCGHGNAEKRCIIVDRNDRAKAQEVLSSVDPSIRIGAWEIVYSGGECK